MGRVNNNEHVELLVEALENIDQGFLVYDKNLTIIAFNRRALNILSMPTDQFAVGGSFEDWVRFAAERNGYGAKGSVEERIGTRLDIARSFQPYRTDQTRLDGRIVELVGNPISNIGFVTTYTDVTNQRKLEIQLREAIDAFSSGFALYDEDDRIVLFNSHYQKSVEENAPGTLKIGRTFEELLNDWATSGAFNISEDDRETYISTRLQNRRQAPTQFESQLNDGHWVLISEYKTSSGGTSVAITQIDESKKSERDRQLTLAELSREIDERKEAENASEQLSHAIENVPVGIALFDSDDRLSFFNEQYVAMDPNSIREVTKTGVQFEEIIRTLVKFKLVEVAIGREEEWVQLRMEQHRNPSGTFEVRRTDSTLQVSENRTPDGGTLHIVVDVSEQRAVEEHLRRAQRMEAVGQLTGGVAHDFNNLLAVMIGNAEILEESLGDDEELNQNIQAIIRSVNRGSSLTSRLLAFSRQQTLAPSSANVTDLVGGLDDMIRRTLGETIDLKIVAAPNLWPAMIDAHQFENAVINMAINARDAMPNGGKLVINSSNVVLDANYSERQQEVTPGEYVELAVSDTGTGMSPEVLERVFEPFFTTKDVGEGSGLGLSMVYGFAKQSNGHVTIDSEIGHGTTAKLYMPRSQGPFTHEELVDEKLRQQQGFERILIVEDDPNVRDVPVTLLRDQGYEIVEAGNGEEAIAHLKNDQIFDLIFTDIGLPGGMNGVEVAEEAKRIQPDIKILFTTGYVENALAHEWQFDPAVMLVKKPYRKTELLEKVRAVLDKNSN